MRVRAALESAGVILRRRNGGGREGREMTWEQCRKARERLDWTRLELAAAADVPLWFIAAFEDRKATPDFLAGYEVDLRTALEPEALALRARR